MRTYIKTLALLHFFLSLAAADNDDNAVMLKLLTAMKSAPEGWSVASSPCRWKGVTCDFSGRVSAINLAGQFLSGILASDALGSLSKLSTLSLQGNYFAGDIPSLANLSLLQEVHLDGNLFTSIPEDCFQGLTSLRTLTMNDNSNLISWSFPSEVLSELPNLVTLYATSCNIMGSLPDVFDHSFVNLQNLWLSGNNLTGSLPPSLRNSRLKNLRLSNQELRLSGTIEVLANMTYLCQVWPNNNKFTGQIPDLLRLDGLFDLS